jgi:hypothetical protein
VPEIEPQTSVPAAAPETRKVGDRVTITDVKFREHAHHACYIGQTGTVTRVWKTKPYVEVTLDSGKKRDCCPEYLAAAPQSTASERRKPILDALLNASESFAAAPQRDTDKPTAPETRTLNKYAKMGVNRREAALAKLMELRAKRGGQFLTSPQPDAQAQAVPVDWQALAISRYERMEEYRAHAEALAAALRTIDALADNLRKRLGRSYQRPQATEIRMQVRKALAAWEKEGK